MNAVIEAVGVTKRFREVTAVDDVTMAIEEGSIAGLLGNNGAGKTTLMSLITGQAFASSGTVRVFGTSPVENDDVLARTCYVREDMRYPSNFRIGHVLDTGSHFYQRWDSELARAIVDAFELPRRRQIRKFSRGMRSAVGIMIGLASRAPVTIFDEPYLGLDVAARQRFYDLLLADYAAHPRTVVLSTHLIDEAAGLLDRVLLLHRGELLLDEDADGLRGRAARLTGQADAAERLARPYTVLHRESLGSMAAVTIFGDLDPQLSRGAAGASVEFEPVSLQHLVGHADALAHGRAADHHTSSTGART